MQEPRILIVEPDERVSRVLGRIITRMGYAAFAAIDYDSFKTLYNEQVPAAILLNLEITGNDNTVYCRYLVEQKSTATIILLSDREEDETAYLMKLGLSAGLNMGGVLRKPVDVEAVKELLAGRVPPQPSSPLKKSHEHGRIRRTKNRKQGITFDPDQQIEWQSCFIIDTKHNMYNRTTDLIPISILQGIIP